MEKIKHPYYPIIYVRGYAMTQGEIDDTSATPYMGFNLLPLSVIPALRLTDKGLVDVLGMRIAPLFED